ncbi:MAG: TlpA family protein disulfide reductase [Haloglomus sp.]
MRDGESFTIGGLEPPVVVQSFAVWCPKCQRQSEQLAQVGDSVTVVGLNTDPNEDAAKVRQHAEENGFDWRFAVAPTEMTESLIDEFGTTVTNAPSTPLIFVCSGGSTTFKSGGIQSAAEIESTAGDC